MPLVSKTFSEIITFTRASTATYYNAAGALTSAAIDEPRLDYNPSTLAAQGLLIEEARTNSIRNNTMVGAVAGTPGTLPTNWVVSVSGSTGLTSEVVSTGTEDGIAYIDYKVSGIAVGAGSLSIAFELNSQTAASQNQVWTVSMYRRLIAGSFNGLTTTATNIFLNSYLSTGTFDASSASQVRNESIPTSAALKTQRATLTGTLSSATAARVNGGMILTIANGAAIDITLRIGLPQLELGAFATSVIPTTTIALTRATDVASVNTLSPWYNASEGTLYCESVSNASSVDSTNLALSDGTNNNRIQFGTGAANTVWNPFVVVSGSSVATLTQSASFSPKTSAKLALAYKFNDFAATTAGASPVTDTSGAVPTLNILRIGASGSGVVTWNSWIRRITYYPRKLSSAELQSLTT